jgi:hypothetical protein
MTTVPNGVSNKHAITFRMAITAMATGENPISWANTNYIGNPAVAATRAKLVNQVIIAPIN